MLMAITASTTSDRSIHVSRKYAANKASATARMSSRKNNGVVTHKDGKTPSRNNWLTRILLVSDSPKSPRSMARASRGNWA